MHASKVVDGHACCCWTIFGKIMGVRFWNFSDRTIGCGVIDPCTQSVARVHARKVVDGHTCCCWTNFGKVLGVRFQNFSNRIIGCGVIDPCTHGVAVAQSGRDVTRPKWPKNASPFS